MISLEQAKQLVALLENEQQQEANLLVKDLYENASNAVIEELGELTRDLHEAIKQFSSDERMSQIANDEIPDARDRLQYVIDKTEDAANKTMDAVDRCMPIAENLHEGLLKVRPQWNELMHGRIDITEFKALCHNIDDLLGQVEGDSSELRGQLTEILMAQDFQDLTGQIISRVITLVNELENRLVNILAAHKNSSLDKSTDNNKKASTDPEGPILNPHDREDAVSSQDEVDDLLSSLGF